MPIRYRTSVSLAATKQSLRSKKVFPARTISSPRFIALVRCHSHDGAIYNFSVRGEGTDYQAELKVVGRDVIRTNVGSFPTIVTQIKVNNSPLKNLKVYFSDDERHVPVLMSASCKVR